MKRVDTANKLLKSNENCICFGRNVCSPKNTNKSKIPQVQLLLYQVKSDILCVQTANTVGFYFVANDQYTKYGFGSQ